MPKRSLAGQLDQAITKMLAGSQKTKPVRSDKETEAYLAIARTLRDLPREGFKATLKKNLERSISMATTAESTAVRTFAAPRLTFKRAAKAIEFYKEAFGAKETVRFENEMGLGHAEMTIGDSVIMFAEEWPAGGRYSAETWGHSPVLMEIQVSDVDAFVKHAVVAGAKLLHPPTDEFYGYRVASVLDPFGYSWGVHAIKEELSVEEMHRRFREMMPPPRKPAVSPIPKGYRALTPYLVAQDADALVNFVKQTFNAEEKFRAVGSAGGYHCEVKLGDSMLMIGGGGPGLSWSGETMPGAFHVYVRNCDEVYQRALAAGGESMGEPTDQSYGERSASVKDSAGNYWYIATYQGDSYKWKGATDVMPYLHPLRADPMISFLKRAFGAEEVSRYATPEGVVQHAVVTINDSPLEMGEAHDKYQPMHSMFYIYVPDCDSVYKNALAAGATSIAEPKDQPYGDRNGAVKDPFGNQWYIGTHIKDVTS